MTGDWLNPEVLTWVWPALASTSACLAACMVVLVGLWWGQGR